MGTSVGRETSEFSGQHWHFVGILGSGMQAMARYAAERGVSVTGSDVQPSPAAADLRRLGIQVQLSQDKANFDRATNLVVISQAIEESNRELVHARELGLEVVKYPELLGRLMDAQPGIAVAGAHGKSTTTAMIAYVLYRAGRDPSYLIGADVPQLGGGSHHGTGEYLVAEACEYRRSFLYLAPHVGVISNIDLEHTDYYHDIWDIQEAFCDFAGQIDADGALVLNADDANSRVAADAAQCEVVRYGIDDSKAQCRAERIWRAKKHTNFNLVYKGKQQGRFSIQLYGTHNIYNTLAAIAACHQAGLSFDEMRLPIAEFEGAARRLQLLGEPWDVAILSDYAHHPSEIRASLAATKQRFPNRRVFCLFQPHQYSRTLAMLPQLAEAFRGSWTTLVTDIFAARDSEEDRQRVSATDLVQLMNHLAMTAHYVPELSDLEDIAVAEVVPRDVVLVMGAGNVWRVARNIVPRIAEKGRRQIAA
jgi:UDP-N-acetylmuramate--alanine ligase